MKEVFTMSHDVEKTSEKSSMFLYILLGLLALCFLSVVGLLIYSYLS
jgi:Na+/proline symporter